MWNQGQRPSGGMKIKTERWWPKQDLEMHPQDKKNLWVVFVLWLVVVLMIWGTLWLWG